MKRYPSVQFSSVAHSCLTLCDPMDCSTPGFPVHHQLLGLAQTHVHWVSDAIQPSYPLSSPFPPAFNLSQHQGLSQWVISSHQVAKLLEFQLQHPSFQWSYQLHHLTYYLFRKWELRDLLSLLKDLLIVTLLGHKELNTAERLTHTHSHLSI